MNAELGHAAVPVSSRVAPPGGDFNVFLHDLRGAALARVPPGAQDVLSAGCAGAWYFDWVKERYGPVRRHVGFEAISERPSGLPEEVEWIQGSIASLRPVGDAAIDLVFAGQVIEHVEPIELARFLAEAHRVLRERGLLVADSPNRRVTRAIGWTHPEHVAELTVDEAVRLFELAGFSVETVRGIWLCYDAGGHRFLPLEPDADPAWSWEARVDLAESRPEDAFIWWVEARREERPPDEPALAVTIDEIALRDRVLRALDRGFDRARRR